MNNLFNFQPLFFHNMRKFIQSQEIYEDPSMKDYLDGLGFDNTRNPLTNGPRLIESEIKVSNFLPRYFS